MERSKHLAESEVYILDLNFLSTPGTIASYLIPHHEGAILIECGPGSTIPSLIEGLQKHGLEVTDISDVFLTHIHLDHAGAAGWLARQGARIHVHPVGAPHLLNPEKLLTSAARIYGNMMDQLWGEFLPVPVERLSVLQNDEVVEINNISLQAIDTPGHANHHFAYLLNGLCFSGDIGGVRLGGLPHIRLPMPPPEFHIENWRQSLQKLRTFPIEQIAPTHFGIFDDPHWHFNAVGQTLDEIEEWMEQELRAESELEELTAKFIDWTRQRALADGLNESEIYSYETANPTWMSTHGIQRYWKIFRHANKGDQITP